MASTGEVWKLGHRPALDGVRGIAVLLVLVGHLGPTAVQPVAWVGVTVFFALSGFLITALLLEERQRAGSVNLAAFWLRRARRLLPALLLMLATTGAFGFAVGLSTPFAPVLGYFGNWVQASGGDLGLWRHTWSLAVEEQFYLLWPLVALALPTRRAMLAGCWVGAACSFAAMVWLWGDFARVYSGTDTRAWAILAGAAVAAHLVGSIRPRREWPAWLSGRVLRWFGRRSYGIYLWHYPLVVFGGMFGLPSVVCIAAAVGVAELSWRLVERPLLGYSSARKGALAPMSVCAVDSRVTVPPGPISQFAPGIL